MKEKFRHLALMALCLTTLVLIGPARADEGYAYTKWIMDAAWPHMDAQNIHDVEERIAAYRHLPDDLAWDYAGQRTLFEMFSVTDSKIIELAEKWVSQEPNSPYAQTAMAYSLSKRAWLARGENKARFTYPAAFRLSRNYAAQAMEHAERAYELAPDLVSASDILLELSLLTPSKYSVDEVLQKVMSIAPNRSTLVSGAIALGPKWGGSLRKIADMCRRYAAMAPNEKGYTPDVCKAQMVYVAATEDEDKQAVAPTVTTSHDPRLAPARRKWAMLSGDKSPQTQRMLEHYLFDETVADTATAGYLDRTFYVEQQRPLVSFDVWSRAIDQSRAALIHDPYDPSLIETVMTTWRNDRSFGPPLSLVEQRNYHRRALKFAPYNSEHWLGFAATLQPDETTGPAVANPFYENAIVYSNYYPKYVGEYADAKAMQYIELQQALAEPDGQFGGKPAKDYTMVAEDILCPLVRTSRIFNAQCGGGAAGGEGCQMSFYQDPWNAAIAVAKAKHACSADFDLPVSQLSFSASEVNLDEYSTDTVALP